ncbi:hypothetical protein KQH54_02940 [bacterium]|nr:hypothetical protein [bacterium]
MQRHITRPNITHRPMTTAHLAQTMSLLSMNNSELAEKIQSELSSNPALEITEDHRCPTCGRKLVNQDCPSCSRPEGVGNYEPVVFVSTRQMTSYSSSGSSYDPDQESFEDFSAEVEELPIFVLNQIRTELEVNEHLIAAHILTSLDDNGLLSIPPIEIALFHHVPISKVEYVRSLIQQCEPIGIGSLSSQEALIVQVKSLIESGKTPPEHTIQALQEGFKELSQKNHRELAKLLGISSQETDETINFIRDNLNPFPAQAYWGSVRNHTEEQIDRYHNPDIIISKNGKGENAQLMVEVLWPIYGNLQINPYYKKALSTSDKELSEKLNNDYQKANLLIKCLNQRTHTLVQLMQKLAEEQRHFILKGDKFLKPMTRARIADDLEVHESTISRAVSSKSVQLPSGKIIPVSQFFDRSLHVRTIIKEMIENEIKPLSDARIAEILAEKGYNIARRTVAKYRAMEGILPAHQRKKIKATI